MLRWTFTIDEKLAARVRAEMRREEDTKLARFLRVLIREALSRRERRRGESRRT